MGKLGEFMSAPTVIETVNTRWSTMVGDKNSKAYKKVEVEPAVAGNMFGYGGKAAITKQVKKTAEEMNITLKHDRPMLISSSLTSHSTRTRSKMSSEKLLTSK